MSSQLTGSWQRKGALQEQGGRLKDYSQQLISSTATAVEQKVAVAMRDIETQLHPIVDGFRGVDFDPGHPSSYKQGLCEWVDVQLVQELGKVGGAPLGAMHDQTQQKLIGECYPNSVLVLYVYSPYRYLSEFVTVARGTVVTVSSVGSSPPTIVCSEVLRPHRGFY